MKKSLLYKINLERNMPTRNDAEVILRNEIEKAYHDGYKVIRIIHGYGSHGIGGTIKEHTRLVLSEMIDEGKVHSFVCGEEWNVVSNGTVRELLNKYKFLKDEKELFLMNPGITVAALALNTSFDDSNEILANSTTQIGEAMMKAMGKLTIKSYDMEIDDNSTTSPSTKTKYSIEYKSTVKGIFEKGTFAGKALIEFPNGIKYDGQLNKSLFNGKGQLTLPDGTVYVGNFKNGSLDGFGELTFKDSKKYTATFNIGKVLNIINVCYIGKKARRNPKPEIDRVFLVKYVADIEAKLNRSR